MALQPAWASRLLESKSIVMVSERFVVVFAIFKSGYKKDSVDHDENDQPRSITGFPNGFGPAQWKTCGSAPRKNAPVVFQSVPDLCF